MGWDNNLLKTNKKKQTGTGTLITKVYRRDLHKKCAHHPDPVPRGCWDKNKLWDITTAGTTQPPARKAKVADITTTLQWQAPLPWANGNNCGQIPPIQIVHVIPSQLLVAPGVHAHCWVWHYRAGPGWAQIGSILLGCVNPLALRFPVGKRNRMLQLPLCGGCSFPLKPCS